MNRFEVIAPADLGSASRLVAEDGHVALAGGVDVLIKWLEAIREMR